MRRQKCSQCGTMLDVTKLERGSKFACANCGAILVVGEAAVTKRSLRETGPAFTPRTTKPESAPAPARRRAERAARPEGPKKSRLPLLLGGVGAAVVAVVIVVVVAGGGDGGGGGAKGPTAAQWWTAKEPQLGTADAATLKRWLEEGREKGYDQDPAFWGPKEDRIYRALLAREPANREANVRAGRKSMRAYPAFAEVWEGMNGDFRLLPEDLKDFLDRYAPRVDGGQEIWLDEAEYAKVKAVLDRYVAWKEELARNPAAEPLDRARSQAATILDTRERKVDFVTRVAGPFLVLVVHPHGDEAAQRAKEQAVQGYAAALGVLEREFDERFRQPLGLAGIESGRYFVHLVLERREDFAKFVHEEGFDARGDIPAFFSMRTRWSHLLAAPAAPGEDAGRAAQELANTGGDLAHEAVHQLQHYYSADPKRKLVNYMEEWGGIWLTEGWAEYLGGGVRLDPATGKATFTGRPPRRIEFLKGMRDNGVPFIELRDLVQLGSTDSFGRYVHDTWLALIRANEDLPASAGEWLGREPGLTMKVLYAQSWMLVCFLHEHDNGKYRPKLLDLLRTALLGKRKPESYRKEAAVEEKWANPAEAFEEILELKDEKAWKQLQREHDRFLKEVLRDEG